MLQKLTIRNFQKHERLVIDFDPLVTVLTGPSDYGKTAVLRALRWLATNRPSGDAFIRHGGDSVKASLRVDGHLVDRIKSKGKNLYRVDGEVYKAFGSDVPEGVLQLLNIGDVSWQLQHSSPFWLSLSPGEVAKQLNQIVNLSLIDTTLANLASELRKSKTKVEVSQERLQESKKQRQQLNWVRQANRRLQRLEQRQEEIAQKQAKIDSLARLLGDINKLEKERQPLVDFLAAAEKITSLGEKLEQLGERVQCLQTILTKIKELDCRIERERHDVSELESGLKKQLGTTCPLCHQSLPTE